MGEPPHPLGHPQPPFRVPRLPLPHPDRLHGLGRVITPLGSQFSLCQVGTVILCTGLSGCWGELGGTSGPGPPCGALPADPPLLSSSRLLGVDKVLGYALNEWLQDIRKNQLPGLLGGVGPMHSVVQLCEWWLWGPWERL